MLPLILDLLRKCLKSVQKCGRKSQTTRPFTQSFVRSQTKKKRSLHTEIAKSFLYQQTLKQMKQKRSSGNIVHLLATFGTSASSFEKTALDAAPDEEKWRCAGRYSQTKTP